MLDDRLYYANFGLSLTLYFLFNMGKLIRYGFNPFTHAAGACAGVGNSECVPFYCGGFVTQPSRRLSSAAKTGRLFCIPCSLYFALAFVVIVPLFAPMVLFMVLPFCLLWDGLALLFSLITGKYVRNKSVGYFHSH